VAAALVVVWRRKAAGLADGTATWGVEAAVVVCGGCGIVRLAEVAAVVVATGGCAGRRVYVAPMHA
jgi:hypothetical protein